MKSTRPVEALRQHRSKLIVRWADQLARIRQQAGERAMRIDRQLLENLFDEAVDMMAGETAASIPRRHSGSAFDTLAPFPQSASLCIDVLAAGAQIAAAFVAENAGTTRALWSIATRDRTLQEVDDVFHILVHREIQALCDYCLQRHAHAGWPSSRNSNSAATCSSPDVSPEPLSN